MYKNVPYPETKESEEVYLPKGFEDLKAAKVYALKYLDEFIAP